MGAKGFPYIGANVYNNLNFTLQGEILRISQGPSGAGTESQVSLAP